MQDIPIKRATINPERLHADLSTALGEVCRGLSFSRGVVTLHMGEEATPAQRAAAEKIVATHDPATLSTAQQAAAAREALLFFRLEGDALLEAVDALDDAAFRRELARALAALRDLLRAR